MSSKLFDLKKILLFVLIFCLLATRFIKINWGDGHFFHPDENNMASAISQMSSSNLNPHFFAYGQFPLYLTFFSVQLLNLLSHQSFLPNLSFDQSVIGLRIWSAIFSVLSVLFLYLISKNIFNKNFHRLIFIFLIIFNPGLIQMAHFGTTESILCFVFIVNIYLSFKLYQNPKPIYLLFASLVGGVGVASKISAAILLTPIFLVLIINLLKTKKYLKFIISNFVFISLSIFFSFLLSPYNLISKSDFLSSMNYEVGVATGQMKVFYTSQFLNTHPYLFQFTHIFPYVSGIFVFILSFLGLVLVLKTLISRHKSSVYLLLIFIPSFLYFLYQGQLYVKWTRFMSPIFFIFPFLAAYFISRIKNKNIIYLLTLICIIPGILFLNLYISPDIRITASKWIDQNIPKESKILSEGGNVINLPLSGNGLSINNFNFYELEQDPKLITSLPSAILDSNYILVPSRRIFKNQNNSNFPVSKNYYQNLFSNKLGFTHIKTFDVITDLILSPENAEETWTVFDRPTIRLYQKTVPFELSQYQNLINKNLL